MIDSRILADRSPYVVIYDEDLRLPDGTILTEFVRVDIPPFAIVFAVLEDGRVPFVRQYRRATGSYTLELPAGHLEPGEEALTCAQRELHEEAGIEADDWQFLGQYVMNANRGCGWGYAFLARGARIVGESHHGDVGEMSVHLLPLDEARRIWEAGELVIAPVALTVGLALNALGK